MMILYFLRIIVSNQGIIEMTLPLPSTRSMYRQYAKIAHTNDQRKQKPCSKPNSLYVLRRRSKSVDYNSNLERKLKQ